MTQRGMARNSKPGLKDPDDKTKRRAKRMLERALKYLESELKVLVDTPGNGNEVLRLANGLDRLTRGQPEEPADRKVRGDWDLGLDAPVQED